MTSEQATNPTVDDRADTSPGRAADDLEELDDFDAAWWAATEQAPARSGVVGGARTVIGWAERPAQLVHLAADLGRSVPDTIALIGRWGGEAVRRYGWTAAWSITSIPLRPGPPPDGASTSATAHCRLRPAPVRDGAVVRPGRHRGRGLPGHQHPDPRAPRS